MTLTREKKDRLARRPQWSTDSLARRKNNVRLHRKTRKARVRLTTASTDVSTGAGASTDVGTGSKAGSVDAVARGATDDFRWAHVTWAFLHEMSFYIDMHENENPEAQAAFQSTITALVSFLPCMWCRTHLSAHLEANPLPAPSSYAADAFPNARWVVDLHNAVNTRQHKGVVPFEDVRAHYVDGAAQPTCPSVGMVKEGETVGAGAHKNKNSHTNNSIVPCDRPREFQLINGCIISIAVVVVFFVLAALTLQLVHIYRK